MFSDIHTEHINTGYVQNKISVKDNETSGSLRREFLDQRIDREVFKTTSPTFCGPNNPRRL